MSDRHIDEALRELLVEGGELTKSLLGLSGGKIRPPDRQIDDIMGASELRATRRTLSQSTNSR